MISKTMKTDDTETTEPIFTMEDMRDYLSEELLKYENMSVVVNGTDVPKKKDTDGK